MRASVYMFLRVCVWRYQLLLPNLFLSYELRAQYVSHTESNDVYVCPIFVATWNEVFCDAKQEIVIAAWA